MAGGIIGTDPMKCPECGRETYILANGKYCEACYKERYPRRWRKVVRSMYGRELGHNPRPDRA